MHPQDRKGLPTEYKAINRLFLNEGVGRAVPVAGATTATLSGAANRMGDGMKKIINALSLALGLLMSPVWADGVVHKCKDPQGKMINQASPCAKTDVSVSSWAAQAQAIEQTDGGEPQNNRALILKQQGNGHYFVDGVINGKPLNFVVDTGASVVSIPRATAYAASMSCKDQVLMQTANGASSVCTSVIARLKVGPFLLKDVNAMIVPNLSQPLLGMNVLQQFRIEQDNGEMRLSAKN